jgi:hypothetical protein
MHIYYLKILYTIIDAEFGRENHSSIPAIAIGKVLEPPDVRTDSRTRLNWW